MDSSVGIAIGRGSIPSRGKRFFPIPQRSDRLWVPTCLLSNGYLELLSPGVKQQGREADHSPPSSAEVKNNEVTPPLPIHHTAVENKTMRRAQQEGLHTCAVGEAYVNNLASTQKDSSFFFLFGL
jgi:hypothetical protein